MVDQLPPVPTDRESSLERLKRELAEINKQNPNRDLIVVAGQVKPVRKSKKPVK
jgi:hypothetical protein